MSESVYFDHKGKVIIQLPLDKLHETRGSFEDEFEQGQNHLFVLYLPGQLKDEFLQDAIRYQKLDLFQPDGLKKGQQFTHFTDVVDLLLDEIVVMGGQRFKYTFRLGQQFNTGEGKDGLSLFLELILVFVGVFF